MDLTLTDARFIPVLAHSDSTSVLRFTLKVGQGGYWALRVYVEGGSQGEFTETFRGPYYTNHGFAK
jgi:hypothetical protein